MPFQSPFHQQDHENLLAQELEQESEQSRGSSLTGSANSYQEGEAIL